jgi:membrane-anchored protein YejM (alkaline phosphatase superfamily)
VSVHPSSVLFVTLDSCRYDTFAEAKTPNISSVGTLHRALAPGTFTYSSHAAMFVGFTPDVPDALEPYINPKFARIFMLSGGGSKAQHRPFAVLRGGDIVEGFNQLGYETIGTGAMMWFNPGTAASRTLTRSFKHFFYPNNVSAAQRQFDFVESQVDRAQQPVFAFVNLGETHVPYWHAGATWDREWNPCRTFGDSNDAEECRRRQTACLEFVDQRIGGLLERFAEATTIVCADHGDAWGEEGYWGHGFQHPKVVEVPLVLRLGQDPPRPGGNPPWIRRARRRLSNAQRALRGA